MLNEIPLDLYFFCYLFYLLQYERDWKDWYDLFKEEMSDVSAEREIDIDRIFYSGDAVSVSICM